MVVHLPSPRRHTASQPASVSYLTISRLIDEVNTESLNMIETSIFILCLDEAVASNGRRDENSIALQMLHGQGTDLNSCNRWYDKTMQVGDTPGRQV